MFLLTSAFYALLFCTFVPLISIAYSIFVFFVAKINKHGLPTSRRTFESVTFNLVDVCKLKLGCLR
jgi:hypothetical protein